MFAGCEERRRRAGGDLERFCPTLIVSEGRESCDEGEDIMVSSGSLSSPTSMTGDGYDAS